MITYAEKLKDPQWQKKRLEIFQRDDWACQLCGDKETTLNIHHLKYRKLPHLSENKDLITLCQTCHFEIEYIKKIPDYAGINIDGVSVLKIKSENPKTTVSFSKINSIGHTLVSIFNEKNEFVNGFRLNKNTCEVLMNFINNNNI